MLKIGLDLHGVIDRDPTTFSIISKQRDITVFVITGEELSEKLLFKILNYEIRVKEKNIFSITSFHKHLGTPITYLNNNPTQPYIEPEIWNRTKSVICKLLDLDYMIDDSPIYGNYFLKKEYGVRTGYIQYNPNVFDFQAMVDHMIRNGIFKWELE